MLPGKLWNHYYKGGVQSLTRPVSRRCRAIHRDRAQGGAAMSKRFAWVALAFFVLGLGVSACNTTEGFGQDVENAGSAVKHKAQQAK